MNHQYRRGFTSIIMTAVLAVLVLVGIIAWKVYTQQQARRAELAASNTASSTAPSGSQSGDTIDQILGNYTIAPQDQHMAQAVTNYLTDVQNGGDATTSARELATQIASSSGNIVAYTTYTTHNIQLDSDTSNTRALQYRADLRTSLAPLLNNTQSELDLYAQFLSTHDTMYLTQLSQAANNYRDAIALTLKVRTPKDAAAYQVGILNAMSRFAATLDALVAQAQDPFASAGTVHDFNASETAMYTAFNALATYYVQHAK
jgi:cytoskeletal protein RodZ